MEEEQLDEDQNDDVNLKEIDKFDDSLAMSPCGFGSISGISSSPYTMNGSNVSTHTFRKTEWDELGTARGISDEKSFVN